MKCLQMMGNTSWQAYYGIFSKTRTTVYQDTGDTEDKAWKQAFLAQEERYENIQHEV